MLLLVLGDLNGDDVREDKLLFLVRCSCGTRCGNNCISTNWLRVGSSSSNVPAPGPVDGLKGLDFSRDHFLNLMLMNLDVKITSSWVYLF